jgi:DNA repair exonuclease SbcCD ATPase subunit
MFEINRHGLCGTLNVEKESVPNNKLEELVLQSSKCPITLDLESEDDVQTVRDQYEPMEVASTATTHFRIPRLKKSETTATVVTTSPLSSGKPKANLSLKGQLQLAEQRLASKNVAITAQAHQLETLDRKLQALQLELSSEKTKYHMLKTEADDAILKERQVSTQLRRENEYLQQQLKAHDQLALDNAHTNRAYQLLQAQHEALQAENKKLEARVVRIPKKKAKVPDPLLVDAVGEREEVDTDMADLLLFDVHLTSH